jgi:hypothetical protein
MVQIARLTWLPLAAAMLLVLPAGCEPGRQPLARVRGRVSYKGTPLNTGTIVFTPDALRGTVGPMARSEIASDGSYVLQTEGLLGATVGWHRVTVLAMDLRPEMGPDEALIMPRSLLPEKYCDPELSGLSCQVRGGQENRFDLDLQ